MLKFNIKRDYMLNVLALFTSSSLGQFIQLISTPILIRLYTPEDFGSFAIFVAIISIGSIFVTGRYEQAILLPRLDKSAIQIFAAVFIISTLVVFLFFLCLIILNSYLIDRLGQLLFVNWYCLLLLSIWLLGVYQGLVYWTNRQKHYHYLALGNFIQTLIAVIVQIYYANYGVVGLISGFISGLIISNVYLVYCFFRSNRVKLNFKLNRFLAIIIKYNNFPKFSIFENMLNTLSIQMPIMLINYLLNVSTAGYLNLTQRILRAPITLISGSISYAFRQEIAQAYAHKIDCVKIYRKTFKQLIYLAILPFILFLILSPQIFEIIFGAQWRVAGEYAQILAPKFFFDFISMPFTNMFVIAEKQLLALIWQISFFTITTLALLIGISFFDFKFALFFYSLSCCLMQGTNLLLTYKLSHAHQRPGCN